MCCGKRQCIQCLLLAYSITGLVLCLIGVFFVGSPDNSVSGIGLDILYCGLMFAAAILGLILFCEETVLLAIVYCSLIISVVVISLLSIIVGRGTTSGKTIVEQTWEGEKHTPGLMDSLQRTNHCCGKDSPSDYDVELHQPIPKSCYGISDDQPYKDGCISKVPDLDFSKPYWIALIWDILWLGYSVWFFIHVKKRHQVPAPETTK